MTHLTMRVARPTDNLTELVRMYENGMGFNVLGRFDDHDGFDGVILGDPHEPYHLEFTTRRGHPAGRPPTEEHLLVFYLPRVDEWEIRCAGMIAAGFRLVTAANPYWDVNGRTFEDLDGYRVVLQNAAWP
jgi:hypothetical protein